MERSKQSSEWVLAVLILSAPRLARLMSPAVHIEDPNYIYGAFLITLGQQPFLQFAQPNPPLLESFLALFYMIFGVSYRIPEMLTALAYIGTGIVIYRMGSRWFSPIAGLWAAVFYSFHFLLFRYHLFEREVFATLAVALAVDRIMMPSEDRRQEWVAGAFLGLGFVCKQTALVPFAVLTGMLVLFHRRWRSALWLIIGFLGVFAITSVGYTYLYGIHYWRQTLWFHFIKGTVAPWQEKSILTVWALGYLIPFLAGSIYVFLKPLRSFEWILAGLFAADIVFFWFVTGAFWPHYLLSTIFPATLLAGGVIHSWINAFKNGPYQKYRAVVSFVLTLVTATVMGVLAPGSLLGTNVAEAYGFDGIPRKEIDRCSAFIKEHTLPGELIISDPFIALVSERAKVVKFKDNWGLIMKMYRLIDEGRYWEGIKEMSTQNFGDVRFASQKEWEPMILEALTTDKVGAIQPNYELPLPPDRMRQFGFKQGYRSLYYEIWIRDNR
ncbi:glycosyltransferase family 39 protein [bacterium]|nr:glycosyltransferase family 39 protein [candidate division CSSED10-310 bacterium]